VAGTRKRRAPMPAPRVSAGNAARPWAAALEPCALRPPRATAARWQGRAAQQEAQPLGAGAVQFLGKRDPLERTDRLREGPPPGAAGRARSEVRRYHHPALAGVQRRRRGPGQRWPELRRTLRGSHHVLGWTQDPRANGYEPVWVLARGGSKSTGSRSASSSMPPATPIRAKLATGTGVIPPYFLGRIGTANGVRARHGG
jgi:hypothetical protein